MLFTLVQSIAIGVGAVMLTSPHTTPVEAPKPVIEEQVHVVKNGESLSEIAIVYYDNPYAYASILKDNPQVTDPNLLEEGTVLKIRKIPHAVDVASDTATPAVAINSEDEIPQPEPIQPVHAAIALEVTKAPEPTAIPTAAPQPIYSGTGPLTDAQLTYLGTCEAGMIPDRNTGNGYYGAFQFSYGTWKSMGTEYERADLAPIEVQKDAVQRLLSRSSIFTQFPGCAKKMRANGII